MIINVLREMKNNKNRVGLTPGDTQELVKRGNKILIETHVGAASGFRNTENEKAGEKVVKIIPNC